MSYRHLLAAVAERLEPALGEAPARTAEQLESQLTAAAADTRPDRRPRREPRPDPHCPRRRRPAAAAPPPAGRAAAAADRDEHPPGPHAVRSGAAVLRLLHDDASRAVRRRRGGGDAHRDRRAPRRRRPHRVPGTATRVERGCAPITHLAGGQPRMWATLASALTVGGLDELIDLLLTRFDDLTPYYQEQLGRLSGHQRLVVAELAAIDRPISVRDLAERLDIDQRSLAKTISELVDRGWAAPTTSPDDRAARRAAHLLRAGGAARAAVVSDQGIARRAAAPDRRVPQALVRSRRSARDRGRADWPPNTSSSPADGQAHDDVSHRRHAPAAPPSGNPRARRSAARRDRRRPRRVGAGVSQKRSSASRPRCASPLRSSSTAATCIDVRREIHRCRSHRVRAHPAPDDDGLDRARPGDDQGCRDRVLSEAQLLLADWLGRAWRFDEAAEVLSSRSNNARFRASRHARRAREPRPLLPARGTHRRGDHPRGGRARLPAERLLGPEHPSTLITRANLAALATGKRGAPATRSRLAEAVLADVERLLGPEHSRHAYGAREPRQSPTRRRSAPANAIDLLRRRCSADVERLLGPEHPDSAHGAREPRYFLLGRRGAPAKRLLFRRRCSPTRAAAWPRAPQHSHRSRANLAASYSQAGRTNDAIALREAVLADHERLLGPEHPDTLISRANLAALLRDRRTPRRRRCGSELALRRREPADRRLGAHADEVLAEDPVVRELLARAQRGLHL